MTQEKKERIDWDKDVPRNLIANIIYFILNFVIALMLTPYFINNLGLESYAIIPLIISISSYLLLVTSSINRSSSRYLTIGLQKNDLITANKTFNTTIISITILALVLIPFVIILSYYLPSFFNISPDNTNEFVFLFLGVFGSFLIAACSNTFTAPLYARNRLDLYNIVLISNHLMQILLMILFFTLLSPKLVYVGVSYILSALIIFFLNILLWKKFAPELKINVFLFDSNICYNILNTSKWIFIDQIGNIIFLQMDILIVNKLYGPTAGGEYAVALQWSILLRSIALTLSGVITPIIIIYYAKNRISDIILISKSSIKILGLALAFPIGIICGLSSELLSLWVGPTFAKLSPLIIILVIHLIFNLPVLPLFSINIAFNKVREPAIATLIIGIGNLILALTLAQLAGWYAYGVALAGAIMFTLRNALFISWYSSKLLNVSFISFIKCLYPGTIIMTSIALVSYFIGNLIEISRWIDIIIISTTVCAVFVFLSWRILLNNSEREMGIRIIKKFVRV